MRKAFFEALQAHVRGRDDIYLLTGDLGYKLFDGFVSSCPERFVDVGVAESNMIGIASGLALSGKKVYCYSIIPFLIMRAYEQIRLDVAFHDLNVTLVGAGGGFTYGLDGFSHFGIEDLALMRVLPNMTVVVPADPVEARLLAEASCEYTHPLYIRMGKTGDPKIHQEEPQFQIGKGMVLSEGKDLVVFACGSILHLVLQSADMLKGKGMTATVVNMHTLKPLDVNLVKDCISDHDAVFTVEEHGVAGGLGSAIAEVLAESSFAGRFKRLGIADAIGHIIGGADYLRERCGLSAEGISRSILKVME